MNKDCDFYVWLFGVIVWSCFLTYCTLIYFNPCGYFSHPPIDGGGYTTEIPWHTCD